MSKFLFIPFRVIGGLVAGAIGKKTFELIWGAIDDEAAPEPKHREISFAKLVAALVLEGGDLPRDPGSDGSRLPACFPEDDRQLAWRRAARPRLDTDTRRAMAKSKKVNSALPYARRLIEDEYVQEQLRNAAHGLRTVYERARKERGKATEDKHLYGNLRHAATSIRNAATALQRPKPKPKKRRARKFATVGFAVGGCAWLVMWLQKQQTAANPPGHSATEPGASASATGGLQRAPESEHAATGPPLA